MEIEIEYHVLKRWRDNETKNRAAAPFKSTHFKTFKLLDDEIRRVGGRDVVIHTMHYATGRRNDGTPRSDRQPPHPGVVLEFEKPARIGPRDASYVRLRFPCDTFRSWEDNLRAIALALEALRKIDRYGVSTGSQYGGYRALPPGPQTVAMTLEEAAKVVADHAGMGHIQSIAESMLANQDFAFSVYRAASKKTHPDYNEGRQEKFAEVGTAWSIVEASFKKDES